MLPRWLITGCFAATGCVAPFPPLDRIREDTDRLALAANHLDRDDTAGAIVHMAAHVRAHPSEVMTRAHLAELQFRTMQFDESRQQYEQFVVDAQPMTGKPKSHLLHAHTRLMQMADEQSDRYAENLHRGIGLVCLVQQWDANPGRTDATMATETLVKAGAALRAAREEQPTSARVHFYLHEVYRRLGQPGAARAALRAAQAANPIGLTPTEAAKLASLPV